MTMETNDQAKSSSATTTIDSRRTSTTANDKADGNADNEGMNDQSKSQSSSDATNLKMGSLADKSVKKPPGEIDPSEYEEEEGDRDPDDEDLNLPNVSDYSVSQRNALFQKGIDFEKKGKPDLALKCYLACMKGLKNKTRFVLLPECLKNIADIYHAKGEYEKAIHFAQAEKLFYETALIETQDIQRKMEEVAGSLNVDISVPQDLNDLNLQAMRAEEYEHLARLCMDNNQAQLALEYAGKSAKIRQQVYGSNHVKTRETLDFFASLYAEVGKVQYSDSINVMADSTEGQMNTDEISGGSPVVVMSRCDSGEPVSILRQRSSQQNAGGKNCSELEKEKKQVRFHESVDDSFRRKRKEIARNFLILIAVIVVIFIGYQLA